MPLHDAFSAGSAIRMSRMSTVPTTEDLRYILSESKKHAKPIELPFENNRSLFIIKVTLVGTAQTPRWTFQRGDGNSAKIMWTRDSSEVLMIQNKIKVESAYDNSPAETAPSAQSAADSGQVPIITGTPQPVVTPVTRRNFVGWPQAPVDETTAPSKVLVPPKPLPLAGFTAEFIASKENWPQLKEDPKLQSTDQAAESLTQVRRFARKTVEQLIVPALHGVESAKKGSPDSGKMVNAKPVVEIDTAATAQPATADSAAKISAPAKKQNEPQSITIPLPPPVRFADSLVEHVFNRLFDRNTGLMSFGTLVFFLLREFDRYERKNSELAIIICEVAVKRDGKMAGLPFEALQTVAERIRSICQPHHIAAHVSGSEFAILVDEADDDSLLTLCEALRVAITAEPPLLPNLSPGSTRVAIGAASIPNTCTDPGVLVAAAEMAKEMAKEKSPSYLIFPARSDLDA